MSSVQTYLTRDRLRHLDTYSYSSIDKSPISNYILQPWWRWTASFLPIWLAPNLITLIGFSAILLNTLSVALLAPDLVGPAPAWVYAAAGIGLFFYQTMDALDGKQARRTNTSSPLGELFDHALDTLNCPLGGLMQCAALGLGHSPYAFLCIMVGCWSMYLSTWEEYHTGTLYLGYFNGPVEGVLLAVAVLLISAIRGPGFWAQTIGETLGSVPLIPSDWQLLDGMMLFVSLDFLCAHLPLCLLNVHSTISSRPKGRELTSRLAPIKHSEAFSQLIPIAVFSILAAAWVLSPYSSMLRDQHMIEFALLVCFLFGQLSSKIILAHLTRGPFPFSSPMQVPLLVPAVLVNTPLLRLPSLFPPSVERWYLHFAFLTALLSYAVSATRIIDAFCSYLNIRCLHIPYERSSSGGSSMGNRRRSNTSEVEMGARKVAKIDS